MNFYTRFGTLAFIILAQVQASAQVHQSLNSGGGNASGTNGSVSYTIGQVFYTTTSGASGTEASGIQVTINLGNPLPITLLGFSAQCLGATVRLDWQAITEHPSDYFLVEKSEDAMVWTTIETQHSDPGTNSYSYMDQHPVQPASYYRLKQANAEGTFSYSNVVYVLGCGDHSKAISLYPNPTSNGVYLVMEDLENTSYELYDTKGALLQSTKLQKGVAYIDLSVWTSGTYLLKLSQNKSIIHSFPIIKN